VNQTHKQVAHLRPVQSPVEQGILPMKNGPALLQAIAKAGVDVNVADCSGKPS
jgi:hypothetical protein